MILSLHYIDSAVQCQNTHFIQFITIFLRIGLSECYQFIVDKYRKFQLRSELLLERRISSKELLQWFSLILQNYQKFSGSLLHQAIQITNGSGIQLAGLLNDDRTAAQLLYDTSKFFLIQRLSGNNCYLALFQISLLLNCLYDIYCKNGLTRSLVSDNHNITGT